MRERERQNEQKQSKKKIGKTLKKIEREASEFIAEGENSHSFESFQGLFSCLPLCTVYRLQTHTYAHMWERAMYEMPHTLNDNMTNISNNFTLSREQYA